jgi:hypothetical protein
MIFHDYKRVCIYNILLIMVNSQILRPSSMGNLSNDLQNYHITAAIIIDESRLNQIRRARTYSATALSWSFSRQSLKMVSSACASVMYFVAHWRE